MNTSTDQFQALEKAIMDIRQVRPLILCLTNQVTMDFMANCLLALGAAPIMSADRGELEELIQISHAVNINIGTFDSAFTERANTAAELAQRHLKPIILDPVGAGATLSRTLVSQSLMRSATIIRGNASEILALNNATQQTHGVESNHPVIDAIASAKAIVHQSSCVVIISGPQDIVVDPHHEERFLYGSPLMSLVTGMGCAFTAIVAAFKAVIPDAFQAACLATTYMGLCGSIAAQQTKNPGTFRTFFIDELYQSTLEKWMSVNHAV
jgi:hydroxyethylthiazole kinase